MRRRSTAERSEPRRIRGRCRAGGLVPARCARVLRQQPATDRGRDHASPRLGGGLDRLDRGGPVNRLPRWLSVTVLSLALSASAAAAIAVGVSLTGPAAVEAAPPGCDSSNTPQ